MCRSAVLYIAVVTALVGLSAGCRTNANKTAPKMDTSTEPDVIVVESFFKDGTLRIREYVTYSDHGAKINHGLYTRWYPSGAMECEMTFAHGAKHGTATFWHRNAQKWTQEDYVRGVKQGPRVTWNDSGGKVKEEQFLDGKPHGSWTVWRNNGEIKWRGYFDHGKPVDDPPKETAE